MKISRIKVRNEHVYLHLLLALVVTQIGCQSTKYWWHNDKMVGPNYAQPAAPIASAYLPVDAGTELTIDTSQQPMSDWWQVFEDPELNQLISSLRSQNLSLKAACLRIKEARHLRNIAAANLFPQQQAATSSYAHTQISRNSATSIPGGPLTIDDWATGFDATWEVDLWGRIRRSISSANSQIESRIHDYNFALVTLIGDVASIYIQIRALDERIELANRNVELQEGSLEIATKRFDEGRTDKLDVVQAESNLATTRAFIPQLELSRRQALNALSVLLGTPPSEVPFLSETLGKLPDLPTDVVVGIPADLLLRRPDIRAAERNMAAQFERIGIAEADLYPTFVLSGTLGWQAARVSDLFNTGSFNGTIAPGFRWNILNYGRLRQAICVEETVFQQVQTDFELKVLDAQREVEDGIVEFIKKSEQYEYDLATATANKESVDLAITLFKEGKTDFGRVFVVQTNLVVAQDKLVDTKASIALALIKTYKSLGGGWETGATCQDCGDCQVCRNASLSRN